MADEGSIGIPQLLEEMGRIDNALATQNAAAIRQTLARHPENSVQSATAFRTLLEALAVLIDLQAGTVSPPPGNGKPPGS